MRSDAYLMRSDADLVVHQREKEKEIDEIVDMEKRRHAVMEVKLIEKVMSLDLI